MKLANKEEVLKSWTNEVLDNSDNRDVTENYTLTVTNLRLIWEESKTLKQKIDRTEYNVDESAREEVLLSSVKGFSYGKIEKQEKTLPKSSVVRVVIAILLGVLGIVSFFVIPKKVVVGIIMGCVLLVLGFILLLIPKGKETVNCSGVYRLSIYTDNLKTLNVAGVNEHTINLRIKKSDLTEIVEYLGAFIAEVPKKK